MQTERTVLVVVRTITTVSYLFDLLPELLGDPRVQVLFTKNGDDSVYEAGVAEAVAELGGRILPWDQAVGTRFDLAISASHYGGLEQLRSPLLILPHGPGYTRLISRPDDGRPPRPGSPDGTSPGTTVILTHEEQRRQWRRDATTGTDTAVAGDPLFDRLWASLPERFRYRDALGLRPGQRLVTVSSTWGPHALLARHPSLPSDLLAALPADEYAVAAILHSNIWVGHGQWQVRTWLRRAMEGGLRLMPYHDSWRGALVASDRLVCDHGSVGLYGAALGLPLQLGTFGDEEIVEGTPLWELGMRAPRLDPDRNLRAQIEAVGFELDLDRYADLTERSFANPGRALERLREIVYAKLDLAPPPAPVRVRPVPNPRHEGGAATAHLVVARLAEPTTTGAAPRVALERFPAVLQPEPLATAHRRHLAIDAAEPDRRMWECAAVIVRDESPATPALDEAFAWTAETLGRYPGCAVAAAVRAGGPDLAGRGAGHTTASPVHHPSRVALTLRDGRRFSAVGKEGSDAGLLASAVYAWLMAQPPGAAPLPGRLVVTVGEKQARFRLSAPLPEPQPAPA